MESMRLFKYSRTSTLILLNKIDQKLWDIQPEGFPNNIRWNAGHVYITAEDYLNDADKDYEFTPIEWKDYFIDGTSPSDWDKNVPTPDVIMRALQEQEHRIERFFKEKLANPASVTRDVNGLMLDTVDASLQFVTWHEGIHLGLTNALRKFLNK